MLEKFVTLDKDIFHRVLKIAVQKLEQKKRIQLDFHFFENYLHPFSKDLSLPKKVYLLCDSMDNNFDHDCKDLFELVKLDKHFFLEYLKWIGKDNFTGVVMSDFIFIKAWGVITVFSVLIPIFKNQSMDISRVKDYFIGRCDEIISLSLRGDPWIFWGRPI